MLFCESWGSKLLIWHVNFSGSCIDQYLERNHRNITHLDSYRLRGNHVSQRSTDMKKTAQPTG